MDALTALIRDDAVQSMPPYALWVAGREEILAFWTGPGAGCRGSRVVPAPDANGLPAFGQYRPRPDGDGHDPWALQVVRPGPGGIAEFAFFLDTTRIFPLFGLPDHLPRR
jgi:RNA polymerase sigma-70 factor (ECF subfamily)